MKSWPFSRVVFISFVLSVALLGGTSYPYEGEFYGEWKSVDHPAVDRLLVAEGQIVWLGCDSVSYEVLSDDRNGWEIDMPFSFKTFEKGDSGRGYIIVFDRREENQATVKIFDKSGDEKRGDLIFEEKFVRVEFDNERNFKGRIGVYEISMKLFVASSGGIAGYYYYDRYKTKINISGNLVDNHIKMTAFDSKHNVLEEFSGICSGNEVHGVWRKDIRKLTFDLVQNPWDDHIITCEEMHGYPKEVFEEEYIDLGSGYGSPNQVDYSCEGSLYVLPFLRKLIGLSEVVRSEGSRQPCFGSISQLHRRIFLFRLLKAGLAPELNAKQSQEWEENVSSWRPYNLYKNHLKYFKLWAHQSLYNFEIYNKFWREYAKTKIILIDYYREKFKFSPENANYFADHALKIIVQFAAGSYPYDLQDGTPDISEIEKIIADPNSTEEDLAAFLEKDISQADLDQALKVALLYRKQKKILKNLLQKGARIDSGDESALLFALNSLDDVRFLLGQGADTNYENGFGKTALFYAIGRNNHELANLLIQNNADVNHAYLSNKQLTDKFWKNKNTFYQSYCLLDHTKRMPLMHAAQNSDVAMLQLLLENGARLDALDEMGYNAFDYASMGKKDNNVIYLRSLGLKSAIESSGEGPE